MRKITLLTTVTLLSMACLGSQKLTVDAASGCYQSFFGCGNKIIISYGNLDKFPCFPGINFPGNNKPEVEVPDNNIPNAPETEAPENNIPESNKPENNVPEVETPDDNESLTFVEQVVNLVNIERAKEGLAPLAVDKNVQAAAQVRAVEIKTSFSHTRPSGSNFSTALKEQGVSYRRSGENIAWGQRTPEEVVKAWMNSAGHRANIMNKNFTKIGVGYYQDAKGVNYWSQLFIG